MAVKYKEALIENSWRDRLHRYLSGLLKKKHQNLIQVNSRPDHLHLLVGCNPSFSFPQLVDLVKSESSKWITNYRFCKGKFEWQEGYGAFSYSAEDVPQVIKYIQDQETIHQKETFLEEYKRILTSMDIVFDEREIFEDPQ